MIRREPTHELSFEISAMLSRFADLPDPSQIVQTLVDARVDFVLISAHAIGGWTGEPRATADVDIIVKRGHGRRAIRAVTAVWPGLQTREFRALTRLADPKSGQVVLDLIKPNAPLYKAVLQNTQPVGGYRIPTVEMALVLKYAAMSAGNRELHHRLKDASDFAAIVKGNFDFLDLDRLMDLARLVGSQAPKIVAECIRDVRAGRAPRALRRSFRPKG